MTLDEFINEHQIGCNPNQYKPKVKVGNYFSFGCEGGPDVCMVVTEVIPVYCSHELHKFFYKASALLDKRCWGYFQEESIACQLEDR